ncbi:MAG: glycoside hydrolase family 9 protein, partial [Bacteroidota bacterium]
PIKYVCMIRFCLLTFLVISQLMLVAQEPSAFIHLDQFGYLPNAEKVAVLADPQVGQNAALSYTPGSTFEVRDASTNFVVWTGSASIWNNGATHDVSGDKGWWVDFSSLTTPGTYYLIDTGTGERTGNFNINDGVYNSVMADAGRAFYYNRCNATKAAPYAEASWTDGVNFTNSLQDTECSYVYDRQNASLRRDLSGGWFDAGDYNKYVSFAQSAVSDLLSAYTESPQAFTDNWNIPESGNGIPDVLDEVKWEIDWLLKMVNADGSVINKMGNTNESNNNAAPPSANTGPRFYGPTCTSASIAASAMLAHAATVFGDVSAWTTYSQELVTEAESTFAYWLAARNNNALEYDCDDGTIQAGDADRSDLEQKEIALTAAIWLFSLTGDEQYNTYVKDHLFEAEYMGSNWWGPYKNELVTALLHFISLNGADQGTVSAIINSMTPIVRDDWNGFYEADLYRAFMPESNYVWGSNSTLSKLGSLNRIMANYDLVPNRFETLHRKADHMIHYLHGVNPLGFVYLSAMEGRGAERGIQEIYHTWFHHGTDWDNAETSLYGPAPGFVSGGPNKNFGRSNIAPPAGEPAMKSYKDWNTSWPEDSWEITEPAIYYQAAYIRNLAAMIANDFSLPVTYSSPLRARPQGKAVLLEWLVESEDNASHYEVEYLSDQDRWERIGRVTATGSSRYQFRHQSPRAGNNEYRLKQMDLGGQFAYSSIANAVFTDRYAGIIVYPNPAEDGTPITLDQLPIGASLRLFDAQGRVLQQVDIRQTKVELSTQNLPAGWYSLEVSEGAWGKGWKQKVIIK